MRRWVLAAAALLAASTSTPSSAESDADLVARGAAALRLLRRRQGKFPPRPLVAPRIYKGTLADEKMFPYAAFAAIFGRACSSTIVNRRFVLLSKWCTQARPQDGIIMAGGTEFTTVQDLTPEAVQIRQIERWWIHPYGHDVWHDITIARLFTAFLFNEYIGTLTLPDSPTWGPNTLACILMGFGQAVEGDRQHLLHFAKMSMQDYRPCQEGALAHGIPIGENAFCSVDTKKFSMCEGDGGGPVICRGQLYGINSDKIPKGPKLIRECGERVLGNYFMYLGYYKAWITATIHNNTRYDAGAADCQGACRHRSGGGSGGWGAGGGEGPVPSAAPCPLFGTSVMLLLSLHK